MKILTLVILALLITAPFQAEALFFNTPSVGIAYEYTPPDEKLGVEPTTQMTMMGWFHATGTQGVTNGMLAASTTGAAGDKQFFMRLQGRTVRCQFATNVQTYTVTTATASFLLNPNKWNHFACVFDGANIINYQNGASTTAVSVSGSLLKIVKYGIGAVYGSNATAGLLQTLPTQGNLAELMVFNRALSPGEIRQYYYTGLVNRSGLIHYWPLYNDARDLVAGAYATTTAGRTTALPGPLPPARSPFRR